jgi:transcriptional regulator with XRE-family HTH domain
MKREQEKRRRRSMAPELDESAFFRGAGEVVRSHREKCGLTVESLASSFGVDKSTVSRWETNASPLPDRAIKRLAKALHVRMDVVMLECLEQTRPRFKDSSFGKMMRSLVDSIDLPAEGH